MQVKTYKNYIIETYNNFNELLETNNSRKLNSDDEHITSSDSWYGASFSEAVKMLKYGWDEEVSTVQKTINKLNKQGESLKVTFKNDVIGFQPVVPNAILNLPNSMINIELKPKKAKVLHLICDLGVATRVSQQDVIKYTIKLASKIVQLEKNGFRVRLEFSKSFNKGSGACKGYILNMLLKSEYQPLDLKRIMFPLGHPAMFRRICFDWYKRLPNAQIFSGLGYSSSILKSEHQKDYEALQEVVTQNKKNVYYINYGTDLEKMFQEVK